MKQVTEQHLQLSLQANFLSKAEELIEKNIHPTVIIDGYRKAAEKALETLEKIAIPVDLKSHDYLKKAATTSMGSKIVAEYKDYLADLAVKAMMTVAEKQGRRL